MSQPTTPKKNRPNSTADITEMDTYLRTQMPLSVGKIIEMVHLELPGLTADTAQFYLGCGDLPDGPDLKHILKFGQLPLGRHGLQLIVRDTSIPEEDWLGRFAIDVTGGKFTPQELDVLVTMHERFEAQLHTA